MVAKKTKSQKECARKTGRKFIEKGLQLAKKTGIFVFAAYRDPTHDCIVANWNLPKGEQFPDWNEIVNNPDVHTVFPYGQRKRKQVKKPVQRRKIRAATRRRRSVYSFASSQSPVSQVDSDVASLSPAPSLEDDMQEWPNSPSTCRSLGGDCGDGASDGSAGSLPPVDIQNPALVTSLPSGSDGMSEVPGQVDANTMEGTNDDSTPGFDVGDGELLIIDEENVPALSANVGCERDMIKCIEDLHWRERSQHPAMNSFPDRNASAATSFSLELETRRIRENRRRSQLLRLEYERSLLW